MSRRTNKRPSVTNHSRSNLASVSSNPHSPPFLLLRMSEATGKRQKAKGKKEKKASQRCLSSSYSLFPSFSPLHIPSVSFFFFFSSLSLKQDSTNFNFLCLLVLLFGSSSDGIGSNFGFLEFSFTSSSSSSCFFCF